MTTNNVKDESDGKSRNIVYI